jgi:hypothetical protein
VSQRGLIVEARSKTIESWFAMIDQGQVVLPRFQRHEAWRAIQIEGVLENILQTPSLPIGALLTLDVGDEEPFHSRPIVGAPEPSAKPQMHLLDGQQRMTAIWRSLHDDYPDMMVFVRIDDGLGSDIEIVRRWDRKGISQPVWASDAKATLERGFMPISILRPGSGGEQKLVEWLREATDDLEKRFELQTLASNLRTRIASYPVPFLSLPVSTDKEVALNVFIKMNTSASPLKDFDIVVAQIEESMGQSLHDMIEELCVAVPRARDYGAIEDIILAVGALLQDRPPLKKTYLDRAFGSGLANVWDSVRKGLDSGLPFLREEGVFDEKRLPTDVAVVLTCALWALVPPDRPDDEGRARTIIRKALWRACLTDRYLKTSSTRTFADFKALSDLIADAASTSEPELFDEELNPLPQKEQLVRAGWPVRKDRLPRAILAISLRRGGLDFADANPARASNLSKREYHHLYPVGILSGDRSDEKVNRALNCALITWRTNRHISAKTPRDYLDQRTAAAHLGESEVRARLESHLIPYDSLMSDDYETFLGKRADLLLEQIKKLASGQD